MQRLPNHMRDMLSTRNPSDNWIRHMVSPDFTDGQMEAQTKYRRAPVDAVLANIGTFSNDAPDSEYQRGYLYGLARTLVNMLRPSTD